MEALTVQKVYMYCKAMLAGAPLTKNLPLGAVRLQV